MGESPSANQEGASGSVLTQFHRLWCPHFTLCARDNSEVAWNYQLHRLIREINYIILLVFAWCQEGCPLQSFVVWCSLLCDGFSIHFICFKKIK